jgi:hypothetical protein
MDWKSEQTDQAYIIVHTRHYLQETTGILRFLPTEKRSHPQSATFKS